MASSWLFTGLALASLIRFSTQQKDPLKDFCRKFGHQTALVDDKMYIDGGFVNWNPLEQNPLNYTNKYFLYSDFKTDNQGMPQQFSNLSKSAEVPTVHGGVLWTDPVNKWLHLYGGEYTEGSPDSFTLWSYDIIANSWKTTQVKNLQISRVSYGAGATDEAKGVGYYYGGWLSNASVPAFGNQRVPTSGFVSYDYVKDSWTNNTGPDTIPRAEGVMNYIPASDGGMLVHFGGLEFPYGPGNYTPSWAPMNQIRIYDIANGKWYTQNATGDVPQSRRRFCSGATWAQDRSSYNIYLYGGASAPPDTNGFDDVYILSLPSFKWLKWYPTESGTPYPHHSLSCNVWRGSQMLVMGGSFPNSSTCDVPVVYGQHNLNLGKVNTQGAKWYQLLQNVTDYMVPDEILAIVGGGAKGGATKKAPDSWADRDLATYFTRTYAASARQPTRSIPATNVPSPSNTGTSKGFPTAAVAGGTVGGVIGLAIIAGAIWFFCFKRRKDSSNSSKNSPTAELAHNHRRSELEHKGFPQHGQPQAPMAELPNTGYAVPAGYNDYPHEVKHSYPNSPGPDSTRNYSYAAPPPGSPPPQHHHQSHFYEHTSPTHEISPLPVSQDWGAPHASSYKPAPYDYSPPSEMPTIRSPAPNQPAFQRQENVHYPAPVEGGRGQMPSHERSWSQGSIQQTPTAPTPGSYHVPSPVSEGHGRAR